MRRAALAALAAAALAGCPLPQPLPDYPPGAVTPPRIIVDGISRPEVVVLVPSAGSCSPEPTYPLSAKLIDVNTFERIQARWFVNYIPTDGARARPVQEHDIAGLDAEPPQTERIVPTFVFEPYGSYGTIANTGGGVPGADGALQIVELVVSNGFDPAGDPPGREASIPFRSPVPGFETQIYRWVFLTRAGAPCP